MKKLHIVWAALGALLLAVAVFALPALAAEEGTVLYRMDTPDTVEAVRQVWPANTTQGWLRTCELEYFGSFRQIDYFNNRNDDGGLPVGETMSIEIPVEISTAGYGGVFFSFQYARCPANSDLDIAGLDMLELYASTDGGASWSARSAGIRQSRMIGVGQTSNGLDAYIYQIECEDLTELVAKGAVIDRLLLRPYGDYETHFGATRLHWMQVSGHTGEYPATGTEDLIPIPDPAEGGVRLYRREATSGVTANRKAWIGNSGTSWVATCVTDQEDSYYQMCWYNNNTAASGLPAGEVMTIEIPVDLPTAGYEEVCLSFQYGRCTTDSDVNIGKVDLLELYASTDGGESWSEGFVGIRRYQMIGAGSTKKGSTEMPTYIYQVECGDLTQLVPEGATINRLRLRPYGDYSPCYGGTRIQWMEITGYQTARPAYTEPVTEAYHVPEEILRQAVVDKMYRVIDVPWVTETEFITYNSNGYSDESHTQYYKPGFLYKGPAYARPIRTTWEMFMDAIDEQGIYRGGYDDATAVGMDCIIIVSAGLNEVSHADHHTWNSIMNEKRLLLLGGVVNETHCSNTIQIHEENSQQAILRGYAAMRPGDYALHDHPDGGGTRLHIRLCSLLPKVVYLDDGVSIDPDKSEAYLTETGGYIIYYWQKPDGTVVATSNKDPAGYRESHPSYTYLYGTSCRKDKKFTFRELLDTYYVAYTLAEYDENSVDAPAVAAPSATPADKLTRRGYAALYTSNWRVAELKTVLRDTRSGEVLFSEVLHPKAGTKEIRYKNDELDGILKSLPYGSYRLSVDITAGSGVGGTLPVTRVAERTFRVAPAGDVNGDDKVNGKDVTMLQRFVTGGYGVTLETAVADLNGDGKVNGKDVTLLQRFVAGGYGVEL